MNKFLSKIEVEEYWNSLVKEDIDLFIYTVCTTNISKDWEFFFRKKILKLLVPSEIKIGNLEFNYDYCLKESKSSKKDFNKLTIHSIMIRDLIRNLNPKSYCLILDIDAFPLSQYAIKLTFVLAKIKGFSGNIQRTNCINNNEHLFIGPSFLCFDTKKIKEFKELAFATNSKSDVCEEITWEKPEIIDHNLFRPLKTIFKPIWALEGDRKVYGIGTTFGYDKVPINYHHFYSRNFAARFHFFIISLINYLKINLLELRSKNFFVKKKFLSIIRECKFAIKYIFGDIQ